MAKKRVIKSGANASATDEVELNAEALNDEENIEENDEEVNENEVETGEEQETEETSDEDVEDEINEEKKEEPAKKEKLEKVKLKADLSCNIGGVFHRFHAGHEYLVDANVKSVLKKADYLEAL